MPVCLSPGRTRSGCGNKMRQFYGRLLTQVAPGLDWQAVALTPFGNPAFAAAGEFVRVHFQAVGDHRARLSPFAAADKESRGLIEEDGTNRFILKISFGL